MLPQALKAKGIDEVIVYCTNDGAVMQAWGMDQGIGGSMVTFVADPNAELTKALGTALTAGDPHNGGDGPSAKLGPVRSKRVAFYAEDGVVKASAISEAPDDPAGERRELHYFLS